ncbi:MAG: SRPBCC domain-containing protein [Thermoplasmata archaeon]
MSAASSDRRRPHEPITFSRPSPVDREVTRIFRASVERVFHLFTDPSTLPYVMAPDPRSVTIEQLEFRKGGKYSIRIKQDDGSSVRLHGEYREVDPPRRVVNTFEVDALPGFSALETDEFEPVGDFTRLTVRWKYQRPEDMDKMAGPALERAVTAMWENVDDLLDEGVPASVPAEA